MSLRKKRIMSVVVLLLILIEVSTLFLMYKSLTSNETKLESFDLKNIDKNLFAILLEQDDGTYLEGTNWPEEGYIYDSERSGCVDKDGNELGNVLTYNDSTNVATLNTTDTTYCYLYFEKASCVINITNLIKNGSYESGSTNWSLSNAIITSAESYTGNNSLELASGTTSLTTQTLDYQSPIINHKYYGRVMFKSSSSFSSLDNRFEWFNADQEGAMLPFAYKTVATNEWKMLSSILSVEVDTYLANAWQIRNFIVNGTTVSYTDDLMLIDLTEIFGEGNEPSAEWLNNNLSYIEGTEEFSYKPIKSAPSCPE